LGGFVVDKRITIAQRLRPFSHVPGTKLVLPGSRSQLVIYPTLVVVDDQEISIPLTGPVDDFTIQLDLEKGYVKVWGHYQEGFLRYRIHATTDGKFAIVAEKSPQENLFPKEADNLFELPSCERLSLGMDKAQDWDMVSRRADLNEILPFWHRLGQLLPESHATGGTYSLLPSFLNLFHAGFEGILSPRLEDTQHQGFHLPQPKGSPLALLTEGSKLIRSLFFTQDGNQMEILPLLPPEFHAGRMIHISCGDFGTLDIEWTKKTLRRMVFHSKVKSELKFIFPKHLKTFRLCERKNQKGEIIEVGSTVQFDEGITYLLDNFKS
jgi:hypothetical protein